MNFASNHKVVPFAHFLEILALSSFALAQPLFDLLSRNAEFLVAHRSEPVDVILLALGLCFLPTLFFISVELLAGLIGPKCRLRTHVLIVAGLMAMILLPPLRLVTARIPGAIWLVAAILLGVLFSAVSLHFAKFQTFITFLSPAGILFALLFLFHSPARRLLSSQDYAKLATSQVGAPAPVVMVIFDELPLASLLDETRQINASRYPNFTALSHTSNWYRNASTVSEGTLNSVPAIVESRYPRPARMLIPNSKDHPRSLFTLLGTHYQFNVSETNTRLCPDQLCGKSQFQTPFSRRIRGLFSDVGILYLYVLLPADLTKWLPDISQSWKDFIWARRTPAQDDEPWAEYHNQVDWRDRPAQFRQFVESIHSSSKPTLHFLHILLPHAPWEYLPSGKKYTFDVNIRGVMGNNDKGVDPNQWVEDRWAVVQGYQRHLLQVAFVDRLLGSLLDRLKQTDLFDPALIVITADHGTSFRLNESRRRASPTNYPDILAIPLFVKLPHQQKGIIDDRNIETVDILPTIADVLQIAMPWEIEGRSALNQSLPEKAEKIFVNDAGKALVFDPDPEAKYETVIQKIKLFGPLSDPNGLFQIGTNKALIGRQASELGRGDAVPLECQIDDESLLNNMDLESPILLTHLKGRISGPRRSAHDPVSLAVVINGIVRAVTETYSTGKEERFSVVLPESAFQHGHNDIDIFQVTDRDGQTLLAEVKRVQRPTYHWGSPIRFAINGNARFYQAEGWGVPEPGYTWNDGKRARLVLPTSRPKSAVTLKARLCAFIVPGKVEKQTLRILVDQRLAAEWVVTNPALHDRTVTIPNDFFTNPKETVITFEMPDAVTPASVGVGPDIRSLSIALASLVLTQ